MVTAMTAEMLALNQKIVLTWGCVIVRRCTVASDRFMSRNWVRKFVTTNTMASSP